MEIKRFRNKYNLELIPASHENIILGNLVWDPIIGKPKFEHPGMSENIYNAFLDSGIISRRNWLQGIEELHKEEIRTAHLADRVIKLETNVISTLEHPLIGELENGFEIERVSKFHFGNLQVRTMSNINRIRIDNYLEILKEDNWKAYDGKIRRVYMITELYYGSIQLILDKRLKNDLETKIKTKDLNLLQKVEFDRSIEYTFDHNQVPFAMCLEKIKSFNA
ncbi:hypothetical protein LCM02_03860 [Lutimonas saemankumensis]|uniref:hypothetical protein n=1 Tax=Lutimonas saemankumensis TaxID=483016 RepID=UPI001CD3CDAA|nr:hypothetical protein [Lutimonas saemankumensis]MCA0931575.1 hypothetical protein [Lutimonas saemankumensis]